jgi:hypothetical protein
MQDVTVRIVVEEKGTHTGRLLYYVRTGCVRARSRAYASWECAPAHTCACAKSIQARGESILEGKQTCPRLRAGRWLRI